MIDRDEPLTTARSSSHDPRHARPHATPPAGLPHLEDLAPSYVPVRPYPGGPRPTPYPRSPGMGTQQQPSPVPPAATTARHQMPPEVDAPTVELPTFGEPTTPAAATAVAQTAPARPIADRMGTAYGTARALRIQLERKAIDALRTWERDPDPDIRARAGGALEGLRWGLSALDRMFRALDGHTAGWALDLPESVTPDTESTHRDTRSPSRENDPLDGENTKSEFRQQLDDELGGL